MKSTFFRYTCLDKWTAVALAAIVMVVCLLGLDCGHEWGDDFAAYITQGIAISEGRMDEQIRLNGKMHPSDRAFGGEEAQGDLVYVWGLPLLLSGIHKLVGYDQPSGEMVFYYKIPGVLCYAAFAAVLFLFNRRRFPYAASVFLTSLLALNVSLVAETNMIMSDIPCLAAGMASLLLVEVFFEARTERIRLISGVLLGVCLWFCNVVRLNGVTVVAIVIMGHAIMLIKRRMGFKELPVHALPYAVFALLMLVFGVFFPAATSNTNHIASGPNSWIIYNIRYYDDLIRDWIASMLPQGFPFGQYVHYLLYVLMAVGIIRRGIKDNLHLTVLLAGTYAVVYLLPYVQSLRYIFNILPIMLMFAAYGVEGIHAAVCKMIGHVRMERVWRTAGAVAALCVLGCNLAATADRTLEQINRGGWNYRYGAYDQQALACYTYIHEHTPQDAVIGFMKPRALYLNTGRVSFVPGINGNQYKEADYLLLFRTDDMIREGIWPELWQEMTLEFETGIAQLYKLPQADKNAP